MRPTTHIRLGARFIHRFKRQVSHTFRATRRVSPLAILTGLLVIVAGGELSASDVEITSVRIGFGDRLKIGQWAPVVVEFDGEVASAAQLVIETVDPNGSPTRLPISQSDLSESKNSNRFEGYLKIGRVDSQVRVSIVAGENELASQAIQFSEATLAPRAYAQSVFLVATLGSVPGFAQFEVSESPGDEDAPQNQSLNNDLKVVALSGPGDLPQRLEGYQTLDTLVVTRDYDLDPKRNELVKDWVLGGGHLIVCVGRETDAYRSSSLADWLPVEVGGQVQLRDLSSLENLAERASRIILPGGARVPSARIDQYSGKALVKRLTSPLLVQSPYGLGRITFFAIDFDEPAIEKWSSLPSVIAGLVIPQSESTSSVNRPQRGQLAHSGMTDIATQLHSTQDDFPTLNRLSMWTVLLLIVAYLALIGPIDYFLVHHVFKRPSLTWVTFPVIVCFAFLLAMWGVTTANGDRTLLNELSVVDIDTASNTVRTESWLTVYSDKTARYQIQVEPATRTWFKPQSDDAQSPTTYGEHISFRGIPEDIYGGMYRPGGFELSPPAYRYADQGVAIDDLPMNNWGSKSLVASWQHHAVDWIDSDLVTSRVGHLSGQFTHHLPGPLEDWMIAFGNRVYRPVADESGNGPMSLAPGLSISPSNKQVRVRVLNNFLTGTTTYTRASSVGDEIIMEQSDYDADNRNPSDILRMITYFEVAGGQAYTGLTNHTLRRWDLSPLLTLDRAILFGRIDTSASDVQLDGQPIVAEQAATYVRIVMPVRSPSSDSATREGDSRQ